MPGSFRPTRISEMRTLPASIVGALVRQGVALVPGGSERFLRDGGEITITQSAVSLESLLGRFIFSVTEMNQQRGGDQPPQPAPAPAPAAPR